MNNLLSPEELRGLLGNPGLCIIDARYELSDVAAGRNAWVQAHVPGAVHLDLGRDLSGPAAEHGGRHPLPELDRMTDVFGAAGVGPDSHVVVYDTDTGMYAARVWWMLRYLGFDAVQVLDGGFTDWTQADYPVSNEPTEARPTVFVPDVRAEMLASRDEVMAAIGNDAVLLVDARSPERFRGDAAVMDPVAGRIPGAVNLPHVNNVQAGRLRPLEDLQQLYADVAAAPETIAYCGSGVSATLDVLAMVQAGLPMPRLYAGSWSDWSSYGDAPVEKG